MPDDDRRHLGRRYTGRVPDPEAVMLPLIDNHLDVLPDDTLPAHRLAGPWRFIDLVRAVGTPHLWSETVFRASRDGTLPALVHDLSGVDHPTFKARLAHAMLLLDPNDDDARRRHERDALRLLTDVPHRLARAQRLLVLVRFAWRDHAIAREYTRLMPAHLERPFVHGMDFDAEMRWTFGMGLMHFVLREFDEMRERFKDTTRLAHDLGVSSMLDAVRMHETMANQSMDGDARIAQLAQETRAEGNEAGNARLAQNAAWRSIARAEFGALPPLVAVQKEGLPRDTLAALVNLTRGEVYVLPPRVRAVDSNLLAFTWSLHHLLVALRARRLFDMDAVAEQAALAEKTPTPSNLGGDPLAIVRLLQAGARLVAGDASGARALASTALYSSEVGIGLEVLTLAREAILMEAELALGDLEAADSHLTTIGGLAPRLSSSARSFLLRFLVRLTPSAMLSASKVFGGVFREVLGEAVVVERKGVTYRGERVTGYPRAIQHYLADLRARDKRDIAVRQNLARHVRWLTEHGTPPVVFEADLPHAFPPERRA